MKRKDFLFSAITGGLIACLLLFIAGAFSSCRTLKKLNATTDTQEAHIDTSKNVTSTESTTKVKEKATTPFNAPGDTATAIGYYSYTGTGDTTGYTQTRDTDEQTVKTTVKPRIKNGKTEGFDVNTVAIKKPKTYTVPIDRETTTTQKTTESSKKGVSDIKIQKTEVTTKESTGSSFLKKLGIGAGVVLFLFCGYYIIRFYHLTK